MSAQAWREIARRPGTHRHVVQIHRDDAFLVAGVTAWLTPALARGGGAAVLATPEHARALRDELGRRGIDVGDAERASRLVVADAETTLQAFMRDGSPHPALFRATIRLILSRLPPNAEVRAWGEMVDILRRRGEGPAARRLESLWNDLIAEHDLRLLCSYRLDNLDAQTHIGTDLEQVCEGHSLLFPEMDEVALERAVDEALFEVFGEEAAMMRTVLARERVLAVETSGVEHVLASLGRRHPELVGRVVLRTRAHLSS